jgi:hypothetical protein
MLQRMLRPLSVALLISATTFIATLVAQNNSLSSAAPASALSPTVHHTVLDVDCVSVPAFTSTYIKISDIGTFSVASADSVVEATFYGRIDVDSFGATATGAAFELRVDDEPSPVGRARATVRANELSSSPGGIQASMSGVFPNLAPGDHAVSLWVRAGGGAGSSGTGGRVDPGCWSSDHIVVREYIAFGTTFLPSIAK